MPDDDGRPGPVRRVCLFARSWHGGLGDLIQVNLFAQVVRQAYPGAEITQVVDARTAARRAEFFACHTYADRIVTCPTQWDDDLVDEFFAGVRAAGFDCVILDPGSQPLMATPTVVLYGPTTGRYRWERLYPWHRAVQRQPACEPVRDWLPGDEVSPCADACHHPYVSAAGPYPRCLTSVELSEVHAVVREVLPRRTGRSASGRR